MDDQGAPLPGMDFAGGTPFTPNGVGLVRSANITPDAGTGIGTWTEQQFVDKFRAFRGVPARVLEGAERLQNTEMPWTDYAGMTRRGSGGDLRLPALAEAGRQPGGEVPDRAMSCNGL